MLYSSIVVKVKASASVLIGCVMELLTVWTNQMKEIVQVGFEFRLLEKCTLMVRMEEWCQYNISLRRLQIYFTMII